MNHQGFKKYIDDVLSGNIITNKYIKLAVKRFNDLTQRNDIYFDENKVNDVIDFIGLIKHFKSDSAGTNFVLLDWQQFAVANIFGFYYKSNNKRVTKTAFLFVSRKNGKSAFFIAIELYMLMIDQEASPEIILACNSREQAKEVLLNTATQFVKSLDPKSKFLKSYRNEIKFNANNGKMKIVSADASTLDGYSLNSYLIDEFHQSKTNEMNSVLQSSMGNRSQPLSLICSTAGFNLASPCYEMYTMSTEILSDIKQDDSFFSLLYVLDENDNWLDENVWIKSNPSLNITVSGDYIEGEILKAKNNSSEEVGVKTKTLNMWCSSNETWLSHQLIVDSSQNLDFNQFSGKTCYVGVDLSSVSDLTAVSFLIVEDEKYYYKTNFYLPQSALTEHQQKEFYKKMHYQKQIILTAGNVVDYDYIKNDILKMNEICPIQAVFYDTYNSTSWAINCTEAGLNMQPYSQSLANFNRPTKEIEILFKQNKIVVDNNELIRFCFDNVVLKYDHNNNCKPTKAANKNKIDGVISMLMCLGGYLTIPKVVNDFEIFVL